MLSNAVRELNEAAGSWIIMLVVAFLRRDSYLNKTR